MTIHFLMAIVTHLTAAIELFLRDKLEFCLTFPNALGSLFHYQKSDTMSTMCVCADDQLYNHQIYISARCEWKREILIHNFFHRRLKLHDKSDFFETNNRKKFK